MVTAQIQVYMSFAKKEEASAAKQHSLRRRLNNMTHDGQIFDTSYYLHKSARLRFVVVHDHVEQRDVLVTVEIAGKNLQELNKI